MIQNKELELEILKRLFDCSNSIKFSTITENFNINDSYYINLSRNKNTIPYLKLCKNDIDAIAIGINNTAVTQTIFDQKKAYFDVCHKLTSSLIKVLTDLESIVWKNILECNNIHKLELIHSNENEFKDILYTIKKSIDIIRKSYCKSPDTIMVSSKFLPKLYTLFSPYDKFNMAIAKSYDKNMYIYGLKIVVDDNLNSDNVEKILILNSYDFLELSFDKYNDDDRNLIYACNVPIHIVYKYDDNNQIYAIGFETNMNINIKSPKSAVLITLKE